MSILANAQKISKQAQDAKVEELARQKEEAEKINKFYARIRASVLDVLKELDGAECQYGTMSLRKDNSDWKICNLISSKNDIASQWLLSIETHSWNTEPDGEYPACSYRGIKVDYYDHTNRYRRDNKTRPEYFSFGDYKFEEDLKKFEDWLTEYISTIL